MDLWQYIHPDNPFASRVVLVLTIGFIIWLLLLFVQSVGVRLKQQQLKKLRDVEALKAKLDKHIFTRASVADYSDSDTPLQPDPDEPQNIFEDFCETNGIKSGSIISQHLQSIFMVGWENSQLDIGTLVKNTTSRLFRANGLLRSLLSLFIIVGLLGTLFGLAASLAQLPPLIPSELQNSNEAVAHGLGDLLVHLKGAFAPSILGIFFTIIGVVLFALHTHYCQATRDYLEYLTLVVWVPKLYPSPFKQQVSSLIQTEDLIRKNREHVETVAQFAKDIQADMSGLKKNLGSARETLADLNQASSQITNFADKFQQGVAHLLPFETELRSLYQKMVGDSDVLRKNVLDTFAASSALQQGVNERLGEQNEALIKVISKLDHYETAYLESRDGIDKNLNTLLEEARHAYSGIGKRNEEISSAIKGAVGDPIRKDLTTGLTEINNALIEKLNIVINRFGTFDTPIKESAEKIGRIGAAIENQATILTGKLRHEYREQGRANREQLNKLEVLDSRIEGFIANLTDTVDKQSAQSRSAATTVSAVSENLRVLNENLAGLRQAIKSLNDPSGKPDFSRVESQIRESSGQLLRELGNIKAALISVSSTQTRVNSWQPSQPKPKQEWSGLSPLKPDEKSKREPSETPQEKQPPKPAQVSTEQYRSGPPKIFTYLEPEDHSGYFSRQARKISESLKSLFRKR